jgi:hypothetical protein
MSKISYAHSPTGNIEAACNGIVKTVIRPYNVVKPVDYPIFS